MAEGVELFGVCSAVHDALGEEAATANAPKCGSAREKWSPGWRFQDRGEARGPGPGGGRGLEGVPAEYNVLETSERGRRPEDAAAREMGRDFFFHGLHLGLWQ